MDYVYIDAWGRMLGSRRYYIDEQKQQARRDHAPADAVYRKGDGKWMTFDRVIDPITRDLIQRLVAEGPA